MLKGQLSRVPWPENSWMPEIFIARAVRRFMQCLSRFASYHWRYKQAIHPHHHDEYQIVHTVGGLLNRDLFPTPDI